LSRQVLLGAVDAGWTVEIDGRTYAPVLVGSGGIVQVAETAPLSTIAVTQATPDNLRVGVYGRIGGAWQREPLGRGYSRAYVEQVVNLNAAAGTNNLTGAAVAANVVRVTTHMQVLDVNSATTFSRFFPTINGVQYRGKHAGAAIAGVSTDWDGEMYQVAGDSHLAQIQGCTLNDDLVFTAWGYEFDINL